MSILPCDVSSILIGVIAFVLGLWYFRWKLLNFPPGPMPLPVVGNLIAIGRAKSFKEALEDYQKKYGNIFTLYFGSHPVIVLCGHKMIRDALVSNADVFSGRPTFLTTFKKVYKNKGILWDPHNWKANRKSSLVALRDFGLGKKSLEERVKEEARSLCELLESTEGQVVDVHTSFSMAFSNVICTIVFGQRFEYTDPKFIRLMELMDAAFGRTGSESIIFDYMPFLLNIPQIQAKFDDLMTINRDLEIFIRENIDEHKKSYDSDNIRDFIDMYIQSEDSDEDTAMSIIKELFLAGTETSGTTLTWAFLLMAKHPEIQKKCREEIKQIIGSSRGPANADRGTLPYTEATILEVQRYVTIAPTSLPHAVAEDIIFEGYGLKKDSLVIPFLDSAHHDPEVWPDHEKFRPERWLDSGKLDQKSPSFIPFSVGRRACLGEQLAKVEMFVMFVSVLQQFEFGPLPNKEVSLEGHLGLTYAPVDPNLMYTRKDL